MESIRNKRAPHSVWYMGRQKDHQVRSDWDDAKDAVMETALRAKFGQHEDLRRLLLETGDAILVEHAPNDPYWGDGLLI